MRQKAMEADIVVVNHHLFFADLSLRKSENSVGILPDYTAVIFDEAHELEDIATEYFGLHVSNYRISELVGDAKRMAERSEAEVEDLSSVQRASDYFFNTLALMGDGRRPMPNFQGQDGMDALI